MALSYLDWAIVGVFVALTLIIGFSFTKKASQGLVQYFLGGRQMPWVVAGVSMVATTFAVDTPLSVTEIVHQDGISGNWVWWNMLLGGTLTTFLFARLWRRANILTEVEFITIRYHGKPAHYLRLFKSVYLGLFMNVAIMAWVNLAMVSLLEVFFQIPKETAILYTFGLGILIGLYSTLSGIWGVAVNDVVQFVVAMAGSIALAYFVVGSDQIGGIEGLKAQIDPGNLSFFPSLDTQNPYGLGVGIASFLAFVGFQWWASWYPGSEPGGGGYVAQRMMSTKTEQGAQLATLLFQFAHYCLRPWPWILVALAATVLYPGLNAENARMGYVMAMVDFLPNGWRGLMLAAFGAAYMSTISTHLNWGAGYLTNDLVLPLMKTRPNERQSIVISRGITMALVVAGSVATLYITSIKSVWGFVLECGAGLGLVLILRWYWWRINAWAEIVATLAPFATYTLCKLVLAKWDPAWGQDIMTNPRTFFTILLVTTLSWLITVWLTKPEPEAHLRAFYERVRPGGNWKPFSGRGTDWMNTALMLWLSAAILLYATLFGTGYLIFGFYDHRLAIALSVALVSTLAIWQLIKKETKG
ncbi:MAG: Na+:solute symporter [Bacteroidetes bacterium]|nr:Na+:solute symporter [Bacteroidota bacterium]